MGVFGVLGVAASGITAHRRWLDAVSDNIANSNTVRRTDEAAFQARYVEVQANGYGEGRGGVRVTAARFGSAEGRLTYEPDHPLADAQGYTRRPDIDMAEQMTTLIMAQRGYQANVAVVDRARDSYQAAIQLGRG